MRVRLRQGWLYIMFLTSLCHVIMNILRFLSWIWKFFSNYLFWSNIVLAWGKVKQANYWIFLTKIIFSLWSEKKEERDENPHSGSQFLARLVTLRIHNLLIQWNLVKTRTWDHENYLVISGFSLYQGKKQQQRNVKSWDQQNYLVIRGFM